MAVSYFKVSIFSLKKQNEINTIVPLKGTDTTGECLSKLLPDETDEIVDLIKAGRAKTGAFSDSEFTCGVETPVHVLTELGYNYLKVWLKSKKVDGPGVPDQNNNIDVFAVMKQANKSYTSLPKQREQQTQKDAMYNKVIETLKDNHVGFTPIQVNTIGKSVVSTITSVLWFMDGRHNKFEARGVRLPGIFSDIRGFRNYKQQHQKVPLLTKTEVKENIDSLGDLILTPWILNKQFNSFKAAVEELLEGLQKYHSYLDLTLKKVTSNHESPEPVRNIADNWTITVVEGNSLVKPEYASINQGMENVGYYEPVDLCTFEPECKEKRRKWINSLSFPFAVSKFAYHYGNHLGNLNIILKIPERRDTEKECKIVQEIIGSLAKYKTRRMQKDFIDRYHTIAKPVVLRSMFNYLTEFEYSPESTEQRQIDMRLCQYLIESENMDIVVDLRKHNGKNGTKCEMFWDELQKFLDEKSAVHERRTKDINYMPFAMSVEDLRDQIKSRLPADAEIPSVSWIKLNFFPRNGYTHSAINYTGKFNVRMKVQQRLLRATHEDSEYARNQFFLLKQFACKNQEYVCFQSMDDKAVVPIGEPGQAVSTGVRPHHGGLVTGSRQNVAMDHDFHIAGLIPSVCFLIDVPRNPSDSFYNGIVHVTVKDKVFEHSSPIRHAAETVKIMRDFVSEDHVEITKPIVFRYTDGGPDHRTTYRSVQLSAMCEFIALDLDFMVCARTAPCMSYTNPAERTMSLLNLGLQNVALQRKKMLPEYEMMAKSKTLKGLRNQAERNEVFRQQYIESTEEPINIIKQRFSKLKWKDQEVIVHDAVDKDSIESLLGMLKLIDGEIEVDYTTNLSKLKSRKLDQFLEKHSTCRHYMFQIKKCLEEDCLYCTLNPPRTPNYEHLHWVPDSTPDGVGYKTFDELYGQKTTDQGRPSLQHKPLPTERDKQFKNLLVGTKVRGFVCCCECGKRRVVYATKRLNMQQEAALKRVQEELLYVCGSVLFPGGENQDCVVVKEGLGCCSPIEVTYYAGNTMTFDPICYHCGDTEVIQNERVRQLQEQFGTVRPICGTCFNQGKEVVTRNAMKIKKKK